MRRIPMAKPGEPWKFGVAYPSPTIPAEGLHAEDLEVHGAESVLGGIPSRTLRNSSVTVLMLYPHWKTASYWARYHLLTP